MMTQIQTQRRKRSLKEERAEAEEKRVIQVMLEQQPKRKVKGFILKHAYPFTLATLTLLLAFHCLLLLTAGARPPRPPAAAAAARSDGAVNGTATAVISKGRAAVKRAIKSAPASASFVETSKGSEKFFGRKLHGGNDEAVASAEILKKAKQLDFPTMYEVRKIMSDIPLDHIMERSNLRAWYKTQFPTWIDEMLVS